MSKHALRRGIGALLLLGLLLGLFSPLLPLLAEDTVFDQGLGFEEGGYEGVYEGEWAGTIAETVPDVVPEAPQETQAPPLENGTLDQGSWAPSSSFPPAPSKVQDEVPFSGVYVAPRFEADPLEVFEIEGGVLTRFNALVDTTTLEIPSGVWALDKDVLWGVEIQTLILPQGLSEIRDFALGHCGIQEVYTRTPEGLEEGFPKSLRVLGDYALSQNKLEGVLNLRETSLTKIGEGVFYENNLIEVLLGDKVTEVSDFAFWKNPLETLVAPYAEVSTLSGWMEPISVKEEILEEEEEILSVEEKTERSKVYLIDGTL